MDMYQMTDLSFEKWLRELGSFQNQCQLQICRYHQRKEAFDSKSQLMSSHLVTFVEQGLLEAEVENQSFRLQAGDIIWIPPGLERRYFGQKQRTATRQYNLRFSLTVNSRQYRFSSEPRIVVNLPETKDTMQQLYDLYQYGHNYAEERLRGLLLILATTFYEGYQSRQKSTPFTPVQRLRINTYIIDHIREKISVENLAGKLQLTHDYFTRRFRQVYGVPPRVYIKQERMRLAAIRLQESNLTLAEIANEFGMDNLSLFCRQFKVVMGCTPSTYRQRPFPLTES